MGRRSPPKIWNFKAAVGLLAFDQSLKDISRKKRKPSVHFVLAALRFIPTDSCGRPNWDFHWRFYLASKVLLEMLLWIEPHAEFSMTSTIK